MKKLSCARWFLGIVLGSLMLSGCAQSSQESFSDLQEAFKNPPAEYRSVPFWVWNARMKKTDIDRMLIDFKEKGFGGVFVTPRYGLVTEYLSPEWFELFEYSRKRAQELGISLWLCDDNSYPTGFAGGRLPAEMPQCNSEGVALAPTHWMQLPQNVAGSYIVLRRNGDTFEDITSKLDAHRGEIGDFFVYTKMKHENSDWYAGYSYVDLLKKGVTEKFLGITMSGYQQRMEKEFGKSILGVFSDEPNINPPGGTIRWTEDLFPEFKKMFGYDLVPNLVSLHEEVGDFRQIRHDYYQLLTTLFVDRWAKPCSEYYGKHHLQWTGHYWEHEWPRLGSVPENMAMISWLSIPGLDLLFNRFNEEDPRGQFGNIRLVKEAGSVAAQMGKKRVLAEMYGGGGWDLSFKDQKRLGDWAYVHGVNAMTQHLSHTGYTGTRKYDYPPMFNASAPWWQDYRVLNDYYARLSVALTMGDEKKDILLIEPTSTVWMYGMYLGELPCVRDIAQKFHDLILSLSKSQVEYDLGSEEIMKTNAHVEDSSLVVGKRSYKTIIFPPMVENIEGKTFELLKQFVKNGGRVFAFSMPNRVDGKVNYEVASLFGQPQVRIMQEDNMQVMEKALAPSGITFDRSWTGNLYHMRRQYKDGQLLFLVNSDMNAAESVEITVDAESVVEMDAFTGESHQYPYQSEQKRFTVRLEPAGSKLLFISNHSVSCVKKPIPTCSVPVPAESPLIRQRLTQNLLTVDFVDLTLNKHSTVRNLHVLNASDMAFKNAGFEGGDPWFMKIQYKRNIVNRDTFKTKGFSAIYKFNSDKSFDGSDINIAVERPWLYRIFLNGKELKVPANTPCLFDNKLIQIPTQGAVKSGQNILEVRAQRFYVHAVIEPVYILGNFDVKQQANQFVITECQKQPVLGAWKDLGCPFYPYAMSYSKKYKIENLDKPYEIHAEHWIGTVAEVWVNHKKAGILFSNPYRLGISGMLKRGENLIELRVIGGLDNLIGPFHMDPKGLTEPACWRGIPGPGKASQYRFSPYGLYEDFELLTR